MCYIGFIILFVVGCINRDPYILIAASMCGIGGAIESLATNLKQK